MSNKHTERQKKRPYRQKLRAQRRDEVHRRITMAAVYLHGSVGPARTTIGEIAKRAGVRRATVYNHFPTDLALLKACSSHWFGENPPPDPTEWASISEPAERIRVALEDMYGYYSRGREMLENVLRDTPQVPALQEILNAKWWPMLEMMVAILARGWSTPQSNSGVRTEVSGQESVESNDDNSELRASLRVAVDFFTWQTLSDSGLSDQDAAGLVAKWIEACPK
jgi:AcrR family transcriptional regulator